MRPPTGQAGVSDDLSTDVLYHTEDGGHDNSSNVANLCQYPHPEWRQQTTIAGVNVQESQHCRPDNPNAVAASVKGTNNVPKSVLMKTGYAKDAVVKRNDRDGDGDPDVIHITLEVNELNTETGAEHRIAPGIAPPMWVFTPKTRGMVDPGSKASRMTRAPSPPIRVEKGDTVYVTLENTHYFPHTIHFHGVDHPYERQNGQGNDGVPQTSEMSVAPGDSRTYKFTPRETGTMFYHCHVVPSVHIQMGLSGMFIVTEEKDNNSVQTFNIGAGKVRHPSEGMVEKDYESVYDLQYQALNKELAARAEETEDPRELAKSFNREHDTTDGTMDYYLLNGRSYPYTLQESPIVVEPNERYRLNVINVGPRDNALHTHGHKFIAEAYDGVEVSEENEVQRDVGHLAPAQRVSMTLNTTPDGRNAYSPGVWLLHDHREPAVTTDGISPGGNINAIVYERYLNEHAMPRVNGNVGKFFNESYYKGEVPFWSRPDGKLSNSGAHSTATQSAVDHWQDGGEMRMRMQMTDNGGLIVNGNTDRLPKGCSEIQGTREFTVSAGEQFAEDGEMFGYSKDEFTVDKCTRVTVTLKNTDDVRHQWMIHGLPTDTYPGGMFNIEADGGETVTATFVTPGTNGQYIVHCSVTKHDSMGMNGTLRVTNSPLPGVSPVLVGSLLIFVLVLGAAAVKSYRQRTGN